MILTRTKYRHRDHFGVVRSFNVWRLFGVPVWRWRRPAKGVA